VNTFAVDAGVAVKWVIEEDDTPRALALRQPARLIAPEMLVAECANILWKKTQRGELSKQEALLAARLLQSSEIELLPTRSLLGATTRMAIKLGHPAYDCLYLALAVENDCRLVTADERLLRKHAQGLERALRGRAISLTEIAPRSKSVRGLMSPGRTPRNWLGRQDSNLGMEESKSSALPLGYAPAGVRFRRAEHRGLARARNPGVGLGAPARRRWPAVAPRRA
jgi:predicted nucleic acid-binding protein